VYLAAALLLGDEDRGLLPARRRDDDDPIDPGTSLETPRPAATRMAQTDIS